MNSPRRSSPRLILASKSALHAVGVGVNRIGMVSTMLLEASSIASAAALERRERPYILGASREPFSRG